MKNIGQKLTSRKFIACAAGIVTGAAVILSGNVTEGIAAVITSILGYLIAEGYIDAKAVKQTAQSVADGLENAGEPNKIGFSDSESRAEE